MRLLPRLALLYLLFINQNCFASLVFINEIHYDNSGADSGEFIELAGTAGTDLTNWSLAFYNGSNGTIYSTEMLSGVFSDQVNGLGFIVIPHQGIQNGAPDGIALINNANISLHFLSYEGSFIANEGAALGLLSQDIGVFEDGSTAIGYSLQLAGLGRSYEDFHWQVASSSKGLLNHEQRITEAILVPEPQTLLLFALGLLLVIVKRHQKVLKR